MSASIQNHGISNIDIKDLIANKEIEGIKDAKEMGLKEKAALTRAGIKYVIANFLNEKTGGNFSFLRNWQKNSAKHLLMQANNSLAPRLAKEIEENVGKAQEYMGKSECVKLLKRFDTTKAFVEIGETSLQYCSDLLVGSKDNPKPQTLTKLLTITGTLYQENAILKSAMDQVKNNVLEYAFSKEGVSNLFKELKLGFLASPASKLITLLGVKTEVDKFVTDLVLNNPELNISKKENFVNIEEALLYKTLSFFANFKDEKLSDDDIKKLFADTKDPDVQGLLKNYEKIEEFYNNSKVMQALTAIGSNVCKRGFLNQCLKNIAAGEASFDPDLLKKLEEACTEANKYLDKAGELKDFGNKIIEVGANLANNVIDVVNQNPKVAKEVVHEYNNMGGNVLKDGLGPRAEEEFNEMFDEPTQTLIKTGEEKLIEYFKDKIDKIKNPEEAIQKHEDRAKSKATDDLKTLNGISALFHELDGEALKKHVQRADMQAKQNDYNLNNSTLDDIKGLFSLNLSDLQKDFVAKDGEVLRDQLNVKAVSLKNEHPIQDSGYIWTANYHLAETFRHMLLGNDLQIEINGQALNYEKNSDDIAKAKVLALNNALNKNPGNTDGTSVVKNLSLLADEGTLLDFIPENLKSKFESNGLILGTREKTSQTPDVGPNIHLKINEGNPLNAEINVTWPLLDKDGNSQHTLGLNFATTLDLNTKTGWTSSTIEAAISSIKDLQYTFDGEKINETKVV